MSVTIAAIIPTYNRAGCVADAVTSALNQTRRPDEIFVVDDGSTDSTADVLAQFGDRIRVIRQPNGGVSRARNVGFEAAKSDWIAFLDSDDEWINNRLRWFVEDNLRFPSASVHTGNAVFLESGAVVCDHYSLYGAVANIGVSTLVERPLALHLRMKFLTPTLVIKRSLLKDMGGFPNAAILEDFRLTTRLACRAPWVIRDDPLACVRRVAQGVVNTFADMPKKRLHVSESLVETFRHLLAEECLLEDERRAVRKRLSDCRFDLGLALRHEGQIVSSFCAMSRSVQDYTGLKSLVRCLCGTIGGNRLISLLRQMSGTTQKRLVNR